MGYPSVKNAVSTLRYPQLMEHMGDRIKQLRVARGLTQEQLGKACGVTKSAVSQWELGGTANIRLQPFLKLLETLGTDAPYLIWGPDRAGSGPLDRRRGPRTWRAG